VYKNNFDICAAYRSDNFIVGLSNVSPTVTTPTIWNYAVCGQYPGVVGVAATVNLTCTCNTGINYLCNTCITCALPAVYLQHAGVQIPHYPFSGRNESNFL